MNPESPPSRTLVTSPHPTIGRVVKLRDAQLERTPPSTTPEKNVLEVDQRFLLDLRKLARRVRSADPSLHDLAYFRTPTDNEMVELRSTVISLYKESMSSAYQLLDELLPKINGGALDDLASIIEAEIRRDLRPLETHGVDDSTTWQLGIAAVQLLSKVLKAAAAIENAYCQELELVSEISHVAETQTAIEIRTAYAKLWRTIETGTTTGDFESRLRSASTAIARLTGRPIFLDMRALDRRLTLELQKRIRNWLAGGPSSDTGKPLWLDVEAFCELIRMINFRQELVEHDLALVPELMSQLGELDGGSTPLTEHAALHRRLRTLIGRDRELDSLLDVPEKATVAQLLDRCGQLEAELLSQVPLPQSV